MILTLNRFKSDDIATIGKLYIDGIFQCYTLEDAFHEHKIHGKTRIPAGKYTLALRHSPHFSPIYGHDLIWLKDVPNYQYVLIHKGNEPKDTEGCVLVGRKYSLDMIQESKLAYDALYPVVAKSIKSGTPTFITVIGND